MSATSPEAYNQLIEHPAQPGWLDILGQPISDAARKRIEDQFVDSTLDSEAIEGLVQEISVVSTRREAHRHLNETVGVGRLLLDNEERELYRELADNIEDPGEFVHWFSTAAAAAFGRTADHPELFGKIGLDLGGKRLHGDWRGSRMVDDKIVSIREQLRFDHPKATIIRPDTVRDRTTRHNVTRGITESQESDIAPVRYAIVRQRRGVMDVDFTTDEMVVSDSEPEGVPTPGSQIEVFQDTTGLIVMSELPTHFRTVISRGIKADLRATREPQRQTPEVDAQKQQSKAAATAAKVMQRAMAETSGQTTAVVPIGMHYVMVARRTARPTV